MRHVCSISSHISVTLFSSSVDNLARRERNLLKSGDPARTAGWMLSLYENVFSYLGGRRQFQEYDYDNDAAGSAFQHGGMTLLQRTTLENMLSFFFFRFSHGCS